MKIKIRIVNFFLIFLSLVFVTKGMSVQLADVVNFELENIHTNQIELKLRTKNDFKIYKDNLSFELLSENVFPITLSYKSTPDAKLVFDEFSNKNKYIFENGTLFNLPLNSELKNRSKLQVHVQACSTGVCLLPGTLEVVLENSPHEGLNSNTLAIFEKSPQKQEAITALIPQKTSLTELALKFLQKGSVFLFPILFLAGLLTSLTPCVYPMIPITIGVMNKFGQHQKAKLSLSLIYVLGMVITYSLLGVIAAMTGQVFGSQLGSPLLNAAFATIMFLLGLAMLDFFDLSFLQRLAYKIPFSKKSPVLAVGTMGVMSGFVAAPCTGPILSMILVLIAQTHNAFIGFVYMFCFALGLGAPYVVLGFFSQNLVNLSKMQHLSKFIKLFFACLMFALALYFIKPILSKLNFFSFFYIKPNMIDIIAVLVLLSLFSGIKNIKFKIFSIFSKIGVIVTASLLCLWLTLWISNGFSMPGKSLQDVFTNSKIHWFTDMTLAQKEAIRQNKKILVDVWADWCTTCLKMESTTWQDSNIVEILNEKYIPLKLDYSHSTQELSHQLDLWNVMGLPAILVLNPNKMDFPLKTYEGYISAIDLFNQLNKY